MPTETLEPPRGEVVKKERQARRYQREQVEDTVDPKRLLRKLEGQPVTKERLLAAFKPEELKAILDAMKVRGGKSQVENEHAFAPFEKAADTIVEQTNEPAAIFGSLAIYKKDHRATRRLPGDIDIATTPSGAEELYEKLQQDDSIIITDELALHDEESPLAAIRFGGYVLREDHAQPFEIFGEGGQWQGKELGGLFQLGSQDKQHADAVIDGNVFTPRMLKASYERLKELEHGKKSRTARIEKLRQEISHGEDRLKVAEVRRRLSA